MASLLQHNPKSIVLERGYINVYTKLNNKERRQFNYKIRYKKEVPGWDETMVYLSKRFAELAGKDVAVLDAGCGNGNYVIDENREKISWAVGVDASAESTKNNICLDEVVITSLEKLPLENNRFDFVLSLWVLEHLENPEKVFKEINRVLKPGGFFMFATPNKDYLPLKLGQVIKSLKFKQLLNKYLFGRYESDVFPTYYKANSIEHLRNLFKDLFSVVELRLNSDVSYTSFCELSYQLSKLLLKLPTVFIKLTSPHIMGVLQKPILQNT